MRSVRSTNCHHYNRDDNQTTTSSGREHQPSPARPIYESQFKHTFHAGWTVRRMIDSRVRQRNVLRMFGDALQGRFVRARADGYHSSCKDTFLMLPCDPSIKTVFRT